MSLQVADHWFETRRFADDVTLIWEPHVSPDVRCNIWHVRGRDRDLLLDSGMGVASLRDEVTLVTEKPVLCVASHSHFDHIGGHHEFEERLIHGAEAGILAAPDADNTVLRRYLTPQTFMAAPCAGFDVTRYAIQPAPPTRLLQEGDRIDLGDRHFEVLHLPGHSPGCIALWESGTRTLYTGDVIYDGEIYDDVYHSVIDDYIVSMERLKSIPAETVHCGHYDSFGRGRLLALIDDYLAGKRSPGCPADALERPRLG
jgi:glyoxylase-like metal-dependent hydrolase (beta-lactamase superfamily II)